MHRFPTIPFFSLLPMMLVTGGLSGEILCAQTPQTRANPTVCTTDDVIQVACFTPSICCQRSTCRDRCRCFPHEWTGHYTRGYSTQSMPQRYPYQALQMNYYARPYNASQYLAVDTPRYSGDEFEAARIEIQNSLPDKMNLEYAGSPRIPWPPKRD